MTNINLNRKLALLLLEREAIKQVKPRRTREGYIDGTFFKEFQRYIKEINKVNYKINLCKKYL